MPRWPDHLDKRQASDQRFIDGSAGRASVCYCLAGIKSGSSVPLGIEVDKQNAMLGIGERDREVDRGGGFTDAALLICDRYYPPHKPNPAIPARADSAGISLFHCFTVSLFHVKRSLATLDVYYFAADKIKAALQTSAARFLRNLYLELPLQLPPRYQHPADGRLASAQLIGNAGFVAETDRPRGGQVQTLSRIRVEYRGSALD